MNAIVRHAAGLFALGLTTTAMGQGPTFDCGKAKGVVQGLICSHAELAARDRQLSETYRAALAKAKGNLLKTLRAEQRSWVKGRDECWKANQKTWITATWTVDSVQGCVEAQYRLRTSELQANWQLLPPKTQVYACENQPANEVVLNLFASDPATIRMERGDRSKTLWQVGRPEAGTYEGQNVGLIHQGNMVIVSWLDTSTGKTEELTCKAR